MSQKALVNLKSQRDSLEADLISSGGKGVLLTEARKAVLDQRPLELLQNLKDGKVTAVEALEAFQAKAIQESKRTNCVTGFINDAVADARRLDQLWKDNSGAIGPLHGLPISIKEMIDVTGTDSTLGLQNRVGKPALQDAIIVAAYKYLGAVPFVKTNIPQLCLSFNCSNPVYGETTNPRDITRVPGGSSGGEGALLAGGGSFLGLGTDIAGSARIPSHFTGTASIKPTSTRIPNSGMADPMPGLVGVQATYGIMGKDPEIVVEATKALLSLDLNERDRLLPPVPWRDELFLGQASSCANSTSKKTLRIGWYDSVPMIASTPGVTRAVAETVEALKLLGHDVVKFEPPNVIRGVQLYFDLLSADGGASVASMVAGEQELEPAVLFSASLFSVPPRLRDIAKPYIVHTMGHINGEIIPSVEYARDLWAKTAEKSSYVKDFVEAWKEKELDLVLCPVMPMPAVPRNFDNKILVSVAHTLIYNLLDFPAAVVPVTKESQDDQVNLREYPTLGEHHELIKQYTEGAVGMPIGVQFIGLPFQEEKLCRIMLELSTKC